MIYLRIKKLPYLSYDVYKHSIKPVLDNISKLIAFKSMGILSNHVGAGHNINDESSLIISMNLKPYTRGYGKGTNSGKL